VARHLVPTAREHHGRAAARVPALRVHPVLGKWLYLPARHPEFEAVADVVAGLIADGDARIGVVPARAGGSGRERSVRMTARAACLLGLSSCSPRSSTAASTPRATISW